MLIIVKRPSPLWVLASRRQSGPGCVRMRKTGKLADSMGTFILSALACDKDP